MKEKKTIKLFDQPHHKEIYSLIKNKNNVDDKIFYFMLKEYNSFRPVCQYNLLQEIVKNKNLLYSLYDIGLVNDSNLCSILNKVNKANLPIHVWKNVLFWKFENRKNFLKNLDKKTQFVYQSSIKYNNLLKKEKNIKINIPD